MIERDIFITALKQESLVERSAYLDQACANDPVLRRRVEALLQAHANAGSFLEQPAVEQQATSAPPPNRTVDASADLAVDSGENNLKSESSGSRLGPYKLLQLIGEGGMGAVWMAEQLEPLRRVVAIKVIKPGMDSSQVLARFEAERQALALMDHPNIAKVLDAGAMANGRPYFVMELVKGVPITQYCDEHQLTPRERLELIVPVCQAVQHAHQKGIIHRDLKPTNILVVSYDGKPAPKVIDFGVAKAMGQQLTERTLFTGFGGIVGTLEYMSPEQAEFNALDVDTRSDVYSLGVLTYELLTGTTPLSRKRLQEGALLEVLRLIREEEPPKPSTRLSASQETLASISAQRKTQPAQLARLVRGELDWIVMKSLDKDRNRRYETANALARDIEHYLADEPVEACPPSAAYRLRKFAHKHKAALATAASAALLLVVGVVVSSWLAIRATRAEVQALSERDRAVAAEARVKAEAESAMAVVDFVDSDLIWLMNNKTDQEFWQDLRRILPKVEPLAERYEDQPAIEARIRMALVLGHALLESKQLGDDAALQRNVERVYEIYRTLYGNEHEQTLEALIMVAGVHLKQKRYGQAEALYSKALDVLLRSNLDEDWHADMMNAVDGLADIYHRQGRDSELLALYDKLIERTRRHHRDQPRKYADALDEMASLMFHWTNLDIDDSAHLHAVAAERFLRESLAIRGQQSSEDWWTFRAHFLLGSSLVGQRKYAEAEPLLMTGYEGMRARGEGISTEARNQQKSAVQDLISLFDRQGQSEQVVKWQKELDALRQPQDKSEQ